MVEAGVEIGLQNLAELFGDRLIGICLIETEDGLEADRFEIAFGLRLLERVGVNELAIDPPAVFAKGCGRELNDG